ncbi:30S ribosomal protein S2, partial [Acinetobacter baumannii]
APIRNYSKKMVSTLSRELLKIRRNLLGIKEMNRLPDALVIVDPKREHIAIKEAQRMGITTLSLIDTDSDPDPVDLPIPG